MRGAGNSRPRKVEVVPPDPTWARTFEEEAGRIAAALGGEVVAVHHVGSTAIPGISAKPIVDFLVEVRRIEKVDDLSGAMAERGYEAWGEHGLPGRRFFTKGEGSGRVCHVHVFQEGTPEAERHLAFRDYMVSHLEEAQAYGRLKEALAKEFPADIEAYMDGKDAFIKETEGRALLWRRSGR